MITLEQLDELESRIVKALELIGDLRTENSRLEIENQKLRNEYETLKTTLDQKERDVRELKQQLDKANEELNELKQKESILEKRINEILNKLSLSEKQNYKKQEFLSNSNKEESESFATKAQETKPIVSNIVSNEELTIVEEDTSKTEDENFVEIEVDEPVKKVESKDKDLVQIETSESHQEQNKKSLASEEEIIILDEDEDEIILADELEEVALDNSNEGFKEELEEAKNTEQSEPLVKTQKNEILEEELILDDDIGVFELEDDEDFLIIEENENEREN